MISLKRNSKGSLVEATGMRSKSSTMYIPKQTEVFKISRSKFSDFLSCRRCFYLDRVKGLVSPSMPGWTLNETTDLLLKKEFDICRDAQESHRILKKFNLHHIIPYQHESMDLWRDALHHGLQFQLDDTNILLQGGIDDLWYDTYDEKVIVVDYKSQASRQPVTTDEYLAGVYHQGYKIQLDFYAFLLLNMGFEVSPIGYFFVCNADRNAAAFEGKLTFEETLVPYNWEIDWLYTELAAMIATLNAEEIPSGSPACENCAYTFARSAIEDAL